MKGNAGLCQLINIRCYALSFLGIEGVYITETDIVGHKYQDIGSASFLSLGGDTGS